MSEEQGWASRDPTPLTAARCQDDESSACLGTDDNGKRLPWGLVGCDLGGRKVQRKDTVAAKAGVIARLGGPQTMTELCRTAEGWSVLRVRQRLATKWQCRTRKGAAGGLETGGWRAGERGEGTKEQGRGRGLLEDVSELAVGSVEPLTPQSIHTHLTTLGREVRMRGQDTDED